MRIFLRKAAPAFGFAGCGPPEPRWRGAQACCAFVCAQPQCSRFERERPGRDMRPKKTILCVDDNEQVLSVRKFLLETRGGYRVVISRSGEEAVERFRLGGIDLVLGDLVMPQMDGNEMVRRMKEIAPEVPMILISGSIKAFERANRADAFLPKGASTPVEMLERVRVMIARKRGPKKVLRPAFASPDPGVYAAVAQPVAS